MKTIKITEEVHKKLVEQQSAIYKKQNIKFTLSEVINSLILFKEILCGTPNDK